jgi:Domain of unknown function (DUF5667)
LLGEVLSRKRSPSARIEPEFDSLALAQLSWRLQRLHSVTAPERLRREGLARALASSAVRRSHVVPLAPSHGSLFLASRRLAATAAAVFLLVYGTLAASAASLPDSPLYQVKLLVEDARVAVAPPEEKPLIYAEQASRRLDETDALISDGRIGAAERAASDAAKRIESARAAAQQAPAPQVREAIGSTLEQYRSVSESLASRGGSPPRVAGVQPPTVARAPSAPDAISPESSAAGTEASETGLVPVGAVAAPGGTTEFAAIPSGQPSAAEPSVTPAAVARVSAPSSTDFIGIDAGPGGRVTAPSASDVVAIDWDRATARPVGSAATQSSPTAGSRASATPTPTARPRTATPSPSAGTVTPTTPTATPASGAPQTGFTPIPIDAARAPLSSQS